MSDAIPLPFDLPAVRRKKLTVDFGGGTQSSHEGLLLPWSAERKPGECARLADAKTELARCELDIRHAIARIVRSYAQ
jgi:hypothetical protein